MIPSTIQVSSYEDTALLSVIHDTAGTPMRSDVASRSQLKYLNNYIKRGLNAKTMIVESQYVDRYYLEDYVDYYSRCFNEYPRKCSRIHFFSESITEEEFFHRATYERKALQDELQASYCGFVVIRPVPETFFARICLSPYARLVDSENVYLITRKHELSVAGLTLRIDTVPLQEQDKVVAACATSAIWSYLSANGHVSRQRMPSLSKITDIANPNGFAQSRAFPDSGGLTEAEIARSLKAYNLEPISLKIDDSTGGPEKWLASIRRNIYAYIGNDIPVLLGGTLYRENREGPSTRLGDHIVCVLGYELDDKLGVPSSIDRKYRADRISMIYAHDDRLGQYAEAQLSIEKFKGEIPDNANTDDEKVPITACITLKLHGTEQVEHLYIDMVQLGLYHKVRMQYSEAESVIDALRTSYQLYAKPLAGDVDALPDDFEAFEWSISLCSNKHLKATVTQSIDSGEYNFSSSWGSIREFLSSDMPRYIWRCRVFQEHHVVAEILLDATEAPQGSRVMGHIGYRSNWTEFFTAYFQFLEESQQTDRFLGTPEDRAQFIQQLPGLRHLLRFASKQKNYQWDQLYSPIQYARRALKPGESNTGGDILRKDQPLTIRDGLLPPSKDQFDTDKKYIWIVTGENHLIIGEDIEPADGGEDSFFYGHPTLNANKPARIGGELLWNLDTKQWQINNFSRSYPRYGQSSQKYLNNIIDLFFNKITDMNVSVSQTLR